MLTKHSPIRYLAIALLGHASSASALDTPTVPEYYVAAAIAQASQVPKTAINQERAMGLCFGVDYNPQDRQYQQGYASSLSPEYAAAEYFKLYEKRTVAVPASSNVELAEPPKHGKVVYSKFEDGSLNHQYIPDVGYVGDERIVFKVNVDRQTVKLVYLLKVTKVTTGGQVSDDVFCKKTGTQWKISLSGGTRLAGYGVQPIVPGDAAR
ncbi:MAG: hypothetical protein NTW45_01580 [Rhodocyclales bacterium]|nr:hypothetical protein [Rhodocyclales bacterium]